MDRVIAQKVEEFFNSYPSKQLEAGQILARPGEAPAGIIYLQSGQVKQYDISDQGNEVVVNVFKPPAFFPMNWAINKTPNQYFLEVAADISFRQAPPVKVVEFIKANPDVLYDLLSRVYLGTDGLLRRTAHLMGGGAYSRLLYELVIETKRFGKKQAANGYLIQIPEGELANRAGLSRETVSRQLKKMKHQGLIKVERSNLVISDLALLERALGEDL